MAGFLLYAVTAAAVLFGYGFLQFMGPLADGRPPIASFASVAVPGASLLFVAGLVHLWKPRIAGVLALFAALLIWSVLLSPTQIGAFFYWLSFLALGYVFPVMVIAVLVGLSTVYAGVAVIGGERFSSLPPWLFPRSPLLRAAGKREPQPPAGVRFAGVLLYGWLGLACGAVIHEYWRHGHLGDAGALGASIWILDFTIISAILWLIVETVHGKNWARITLLILFLLSLRTFMTDFVHSSQTRPVLVLGVLEFVIFSAAMILLFSGDSVQFFKRSNS